MSTGSEALVSAWLALLSRSGGTAPRSTPGSLHGVSRRGSTELAGGVTQLQQTVLLAREDIGEVLTRLDGDGAETGEAAYVVRSRSYLIAGHLRKLRGATGVHRGQIPLV